MGVSGATLAEWERRMDRSIVEANKWGAKWLERQAELKQYIQDNIHNYKTEKQRRDKMAGDWDLNDYMDKWNWHRRESNRFSARITAEYQLRAMRGEISAR